MRTREVAELTEEPSHRRHGATENARTANAPAGKDSHHAGDAGLRPACDAKRRHRRFCASSVPPCLL